MCTHGCTVTEREVCGCSWCSLLSRSGTGRRCQALVEYAPDSVSRFNRGDRGPRRDRDERQHDPHHGPRRAGRAMGRASSLIVPVHVAVPRKSRDGDVQPDQPGSRIPIHDDRQQPKPPQHPSCATPGRAGRRNGRVRARPACRAAAASGRTLDFGKAYNYWIDTTHLSASGARWAAVNRNPGSGATLQETIRNQAHTEELREGGTDSMEDPLQVCISLPDGALVRRRARPGDGQRQLPLPEFHR